MHALREVHKRTFAADVASNPLPASLTDVSYLHAAALLPVTKVIKQFHVFCCSIISGSVGLPYYLELFFLNYYLSQPIIRTQHAVVINCAKTWHATT